MINLSRYLRILFFTLFMLPTLTSAAVEVHFLRHAEVDMSDPDKPLVAEGKERAVALAEHFSAVQLTHIFVTNYHRTHDTALPLATDRNLKVVQIPEIGSLLNGNKVTNRSRGNVAIKPMLEALNNLPDGSIAVVIANSGNLFPIMSEYGVTQLSCASKKCFPKTEFNNIWIVTKTAEGTTLRHEKYGQ